MEEREIILEALARVCDEKGLAPTALQDHTVLGASGLDFDSLDMATVVAELDGILGKDPFASQQASFHTVADFVELYRRATAS
ncbi:MAG: acyl carrier protein [Deltaproteobacteria bacterium]|nr:acyl carrier protein [Deltaproteobacteria bacterium]